MTERRKTSKGETEGPSTPTTTTTNKSKKTKKYGDVDEDSARRFEWETEDWVAV
jgi:hypothetical protein